MRNLKNLIRQSQYRTMQTFAKEIMNMPYRTFQYRMTNELFSYREILTIMKALGITFEQLGADPWEREPEQQPTQPATPKSNPNPSPIEEHAPARRSIETELEPEVFGISKSNAPVSSIIKGIIKEIKEVPGGEE